MDNRQKNFENNVLLETELGYSYDKNGNKMPIEIECLNCTQLSDIQLEKGDDISEDDKKLRNIYVWYKLRELETEERELAWNYFVIGKTEEQISNEMYFVIKDKANGKIGKKQKISRTGVSYRIRKLKEKLKF